MNDLARFNAMRECRSTQWVRAHFDYPHEDFCLIWPFARKGGGYAQIAKVAILVHRLMCEYKNGPPPSDAHFASHSCGRGQDGCVNPNHLRWKTCSENMFERFEHQGQRAPRYKLTEEQVAQIKTLKGQYSADDVAGMYEVGEPTIRHIWTGRARAKSSSFRLLTPEQVRLIRVTPYAEKTAKQWGEELGVGSSVVERIRLRMTYKWVTDDAAHRG